jgi:hypothetical protein
MKAIGMHVFALLVTGSLLAAPAPFARACDESKVSTAPWAAAIEAMDEALARGDVRAALKAREDARLAALASERWEGMAMVGGATLRLAQTTGLLVSMEPAVRRAYVFALHRARRQGSLDGVLCITRAFAGLGDRDLVVSGFAIADRLAVKSREPRAAERVRALEEELAAGMTWPRGTPAAAAAPMEGASSGRDSYR